MDSNFLDYNPEEIKSFLNEAQNSINFFENDKFITECQGENFLRYIEDFNPQFGNFENILKLEPLIYKFYQDFKDRIIEKVEKNRKLSEKFKSLVDEINKYLQTKTLRILHEIGNYFKFYQ